MANQTEGDKPLPRIVELLRYSYQPSVAELNEEMRVDASSQELWKAALQPVKICNVMPRKRKPYVQMLGFRHSSNNSLSIPRCWRPSCMNRNLLQR